VSPRWKAIAGIIQKGCAAAGFDLCRASSVDWYNRAVEPAYALPDFGRTDALAVIIGNTRRLWAPFVDALRARPELRADPDPVTT